MAFPVMLLAELAMRVAGSAFDKHEAEVKLARAIEADPVLKNQIGAEPAYKSRVVVGSSGAILPAIGSLIWAFSTNGMDLAGYDPASTFLAAMTAGGAGLALVGRLVPGLRPLFSKRA